MPSQSSTLRDAGLVDGDRALLLVDLVVAGLLDALERVAGLARASGA